MNYTGPIDAPTERIKIAVACDLDRYMYHRMEAINVLKGNPDLRDFITGLQDGDIERAYKAGFTDERKEH